MQPHSPFLCRVLVIVYFECVAFREFLDDVSHSSFFTLSPVITAHLLWGCSVAQGGVCSGFQGQYQGRLFQLHARELESQGHQSWLVCELSHCK